MLFGRIPKAAINLVNTYLSKYSGVAGHSTNLLYLVFLRAAKIAYLSAISIQCHSSPVTQPKLDCLLTLLNLLSLHCASTLHSHHGPMKQKKEQKRATPLGVVEREALENRWRPYL